MQFFTLKFPTLLFFDIVTTQNEHPSYVKHVLGRIYVVSTLYWCVLLGVDSLRGGLAEGNRIPETDFFDTLTIQNDQISYVKHVLAPLYVFFTLFGCWGGGGLPRGLGHNLLMQFSRLSSSKMEITSQRLLDQSQAGVYRGKRHTHPILGLFGPIRVPYPKGLNCQFTPL